MKSENINPEHDNHEEHDKSGHNHGIGGENTEFYFAVGSGVFWLTGLILSFINLAR